MGAECYPRLFISNDTPIAPGTPVDPIAHTASAAAALLAKDTTPAIKLNGSEDLFLKDQDEQAALRRRAAPGVKRDATARRKKDKSRGGGTDADMLKSRGFWNDWKSGRWMIIPCECRMGRGCGSIKAS